MNVLDTDNILCEEQNRFRKTRACIDHIYVLTTVFRNRKLQGKETLLCYVNFLKVFNSVNRDCLWFKLMNIVIHGNILNLIKSMYENLEVCGVPIANDERLSILKYADDIVLIAESPEDPQHMLNELSK